MVIRDVIYNDIEIKDELIIDLIQTPEFQRLRRIKQLGLTYLVFPCAEHSRYSHSIGVYHLASILVQEIEKKQMMNFESKEVKELLSACLLHDLGHGPFSHASENFFNFHHEEMTMNIIKDPTTMINKVLNKYSMTQGTLSFIKGNHQNKVLNSLLSSAIDADRMDYLMRDSYQCGVVYGEFDFNRIKKIITIHDGQICFDAKGIHTIEGLLMSRYHMFSQVYLNKKSLAYEKIISEIINITIDKLNSNYHFRTEIKIIPLLKSNNFTISQYLELTDEKFFLEIINLKNEDDEKLKVLCETLEENRRIYFERPENDHYQFSVPEIKRSVISSQKEIMILDKKLKNLDQYSDLYATLVEGIKIKKEKFDFYILK